jgi:hypothetical protein
MDVGIIAPISHLELCNTNLNLAYAVFIRDTDYFKFYLGKPNVVLDYSPELPRVVTDSKYALISGLKYLHPKYVVLPSIDYAWEKTLLLAKEVSEQVGDKGIGTLQGADLEGLYKCYKGLKQICSIIALPSSLELISSRSSIISELGIKEQVLYLEVYRSMQNEQPPENSLGICTSYPIRLAQDGRNLTHCSLVPRLLNFRLPKEQLDEELAKSNIQEYMNLVSKKVVVEETESERNNWRDLVFPQ